MPDTEQEARWRKEFDEILGYDVVRREHRLYEEPRRQLAFRWLLQKEKEREARDQAMHWYSKWTFVAAVAAVIVGVIGILLTLYWHG
jgi:hypothetical protein